MRNLTLNVEHEKEKMSNPEIPMIGRSDVMQKLYKLMARTVESNVSALIVGEPGSGKSLIAKTIHDLSIRKDKPFTILYSEMCESSTNIKEAVDRAGDGTLVLDGIADLTASAQLCLLQGLEEVSWIKARILSTANINIAKILSDEEINDIREQWVNFGVAIFPNQKLNLEEYENFSQQFGPFGEEPFLIPMQEHPHIVKLHRKPDEEAAHFGGAWHSDWSFQSAPPSATMLYSEIIPPTGGDTLFANTADAYDDLTSKTKDKIKNLRCLHSAKLPYAKDGVYATEGKKRTMKIHTSDEANKTMSHPLVRTHQETCRKTLFINPVYTIEIEGFTKEESDSLLFAAALSFAYI